jgi:hypothetical protein
VRQKSRISACKRENLEKRRENTNKYENSDVGKGAVLAAQRNAPAGEVRRGDSPSENRADIQNDGMMI